MQCTDLEVTLPFNGGAPSLNNVISIRIGAELPWSDSWKDVLFETRRTRSNFYHTIRDGSRAPCLCPILGHEAALSLIERVETRPYAGPAQMVGPHFLPQK